MPIIIPSTHDNGSFRELVSMSILVNYYAVMTSSVITTQKTAIGLSFSNGVGVRNDVMKYSWRFDSLW